MISTKRAQKWAYYSSAFIAVSLEIAMTTLTCGHMYVSFPGTLRTVGFYLARAAFSS
jgi:hypothetical protein